MEYVTYLRVSTTKQGQSGLGLEAQRAAVMEFLSTGDVILREFVEVESGKRSDRPELAAALVLAKEQRATLLIAKLDRLARNVAFIANLLESGVEVKAADMPSADRFMLHVMSAVAEMEAKAISDRTKAALKASKARGTKLGWSNPHRSDLPRAQAAAREANKKRADDRAKQLGPVIHEMREAGRTLQEICDRLTLTGAKPARGGSWWPDTVRAIYQRYQRLEAERVGE